MPIVSKGLHSEPTKSQNFQSLKQREIEIPLSFFVDPVKVSALLESVAQFELMGSKWMLALPQGHWDEDLHEHCFDEVRHTQMVQEEAKKLRWAMSSADQVRALKLEQTFYRAIDRYLSRLSRWVFKQTVHHGSKNSKFSLTSYALLSFVIERRIMKIYPHLAKHGPTESVREMAMKIIKDERKHLHFVGDRMEEGPIEEVLSRESVVEKERELAQEWILEMIQGVACV